MPQVRFTIRRIMALIAMAGLTLGFYVTMTRRAREFGELARQHAYAELTNRVMIDMARATPLSQVDGPGKQLLMGTQSGVDSIEGRISYHRKMKDKYFKAARYPWFPVAADPPEPK